MPTRLSGKVTSIAGVNYDIYLDENGSGGTGEEIRIVSASIDYATEGAQTATDDPLVTSKAKVTFLVQTVAQETELFRLKNSNELEFKLRIVRGGQLEFIGFVLLELGKRDFAGRPYEWTVTATDGIKRLKSIDYDQGTLQEFDTLKNQLFHIFAKIPLSDYYNAGEPFLRYNSAIWPTQLTPSTTDSQLELLRTGIKALRTVDKRGRVKFVSFYDALIELLRTYGLRMIYARGSWLITDLADYARQGEPVTFHRYDIDGVRISDETIADWTPLTREIGAGTDVADGVALANGNITDLPPLRSVLVEYRHYSRQNLLPVVDWNETNFPLVTINNYGADGGAGRIAITGRAEWTITQDVADPPINAATYFVLTLQIAIVDPENPDNGKALIREVVFNDAGFAYREPEWVDGGVAASRVKIVYRSAPPQAAQFLSYPINFTTPSVPIDGQLRFIAQGAFSVYGGVQNLSTAVTYRLSDLYLETLLAGSIADQYQFSNYLVENSNFLDNSDKIERSLRFGDGPGDNTFGRIECFDGVDWVRTSSWRRWANGSYLTTQPYSVGGLLARTIMGLQSTQRDVFDITAILPDFSPDMLIKSSTQLLLMYKGRLNLLRDEWRMRLIENAVAITETTPVVENTNGSVLDDIGVLDQAPPDDPPPPVGSPSDFPLGPTNGIAVAGLNDVPASLETGFDDGQSIDVITPVETPADVPLFAGDVINITNRDTGEVQQVTVRYNSELGVPGLITDPGAQLFIEADGTPVYLVPNTGDVSIESTVAAADMPPTSTVQIDAAYQTRLQTELRKVFVPLQVVDFDVALATGYTGAFWAADGMIGYQFRAVHFALGTNPDPVEVKVNLKYFDDSGFRYTIATSQTTDIYNTVSARAVAASGFYRVEIETINAGTTPNGLVIMLELVKIVS